MRPITRHSTNVVKELSTVIKKKHRKSFDINEMNNEMNNVIIKTFEVKKHSIGMSIQQMKKEQAKIHNVTGRNSHV